MPYVQSFQHHGIFKPKETKFPIAIGTAERKILFALCYYLVLSVFALTSFTLGTRNGGTFAEQLFNHFACERNGQDPENPNLCDRNDFRQLSNPEVTAVVFILLSLFPVVNLVYALNVMELMEKCNMCRRSRAKTTLSTMSTAHSNAAL